MADLFQIVDSIAASPTVRLDLNDGAVWLLSGPALDFSPPPLRRALNGTLLTDGSIQSASSYDNRLLRFRLELKAASADAASTQEQTLHRELDREWNYILWQPTGASTPVFFRTLRTPVTQIQQISPLGTSATFNVEVLAEPFALGLREDVPVGTVNNDPAAGSNGMFFDVTGVKGDVASPAVVVDTASTRGFGVLACRQHGTPSDLPFFGQCESMTPLTDTTHPAGGPDAAMSGTATNNYLRTSFGTNITMLSRVQWTLPSLLAQRIALQGKFRLFACLRRSDNTSVMQMQVQVANLNLRVVGDVIQGIPVITVPQTASRQLVDLGLYQLSGASVATPGKYGLPAPAAANIVAFNLGRRSGTGTVDWDFILVVPADEQLMLWDNNFVNDLALGMVIDGPNEAVYSDESAGSGGSGTIFGGTVGLTNYPVSVSGGFPALQPGQTNRFFTFWASSPSAGSAAPALVTSKSLSGSLTVSYWPRYLRVRPAST